MSERNGATTGDDVWDSSLDLYLLQFMQPGGVALYWTVSNAYQVSANLFLNNPFKIIVEREAVVQAQKDLENRKEKPRKGSENEIIRRNLVMVVFTGSTVEEAIQKGLKELDIPRLKAHIKVISREKMAFLVYLVKPAQVDIEAISETTVIKANQQAVKGVPSKLMI